MYYLRLLNVFLEFFLDECDDSYQKAYWKHCYESDRFWLIMDGSRNE